MFIYEPYIIEDGKITPTGVTFIANKFSHIEINFNKIIKKINKPCVIVITPKLIPEV